jgi:hypothetical protein
VHWATGILKDDEGDDRYRSTEIKAQAVGWDLGIGFLLDRSGRDSYEAKGKSQGFAARHAFAMLADLAGKDTYSCSDSGQCQGHTGGFASGRDPGVDSIAILIDRGGAIDVFSNPIVGNNLTRDVRGMSFFADR